MRIDRTALAIVSGQDRYVGRQEIQRFRETTVRSGPGQFMWVIQGGAAPARRRPPVEVVAVPTWDVIYRDPAVLAGLSLNTLAALVAQHGAVGGARAARVLAALAPSAATRAQPPALYTLAEFADAVKMTKGFLQKRRRWRKYGGFVDDDGRVKFTHAALDKHLAERARVTG
jgi:hypothetical protein